MNSAPRSQPQASTPSLRSGFAWTFTGNSVYAAAQWAILSLVAKLGGGEMLGLYALALALTTPVVMLSHLNLRAVLATDVDRRHPFGDYFSVRLAVSALSLFAIALLALISGHSSSRAGAIFMVGLAQSAETVSDLFCGAMQRRDQMRQVAGSMIARGLISVCAFGIVLWLSRDLIWALVAMTAGRVVVLVTYDRLKGAAGESLTRSGREAELAILRSALPLGAVLMLVSLNTNLPRYWIERHWGVRELGAFAAVASFVTVGSTVVNALGQASTPHLARHVSRHEPDLFRNLTIKLAACVAALGLTGVLVAALIGELVLRVIYRPEYSAYGGLLTAVMGAATLGYLAIALGYAVTAARAFHVQVPLFCAVVATCGAASWLLIPTLGLRGAVLALALAACLQIGGEVLILSRALRRMETAR